MEDVRDLVFSQVIYMWRRTLSWDGSFLMPSKTLGPSSFVPHHLRAVTVSYPQALQVAAGMPAIMSMFSSGQKKCVKPCCKVVSESL